MRLRLVLLLVFAITLFFSKGVVQGLDKEKTLKPFPPDYQKKRLIIASDIGVGDKDDTQSMIHFLLYSDMFDLEGIIITRPKGHVSELKKVLRAYRKDYKRLSFHSADYPKYRKLKKLIRIGASRGGRTPSQGYYHSTPGSRLIIKRAMKKEPRPLYVVSWGSATDIAQAIHDKPKIKKKILFFSIGGLENGYNVAKDPSPYRYLRSPQNHDLRWIDTDGTARGIYLWGLRSNQKYGNVGFVKKVIKPAGNLGKLFYRISAPINVNKYGIKMGDTASILFLMNGDFNNVKKQSWGGQYCRVHRNYFSDCRNPSLKIGNYDGAKTIGIHRVDILKDFEKRLKRLRPLHAF